MARKVYEGNQIEDSGLSSNDEDSRASSCREQESAPSVNATVKKEYTATIDTKPDVPLPETFVRLVQELQVTLDMPIWLMIQNHRQLIDGQLIASFLEQRAKMKSGEKVALIIDSPGGIAKCAYEIAQLFREQCGGFIAVVPSYAKSAATLLALGADEIMLGPHAELGPLDVQVFDPHEEEGYRSALDVVQSVERLHASALDAIDTTILQWRVRTGKKIDTLLPIVSHFVAEMMRPLLEKIDTLQYTQNARMLKEAEEYAIRLLNPQHNPLRPQISIRANDIARALVEKYPTHDFFIGVDEARALGLTIYDSSLEQNKILDELHHFLNELTAVGQLEEVVKT